MTKTELYQNIIQTHKKHGQGLSALAELNEQTKQDLNELCEEGLIKKCDTGTTNGHELSNYFYMPTKGYNVWEDDDDNNSKYKGKYLNHIRLYLGCLDDNDTPKNEINRTIHPTPKDLLSNVEFMKNYTKWLIKNHHQLKILDNLDDNYSPKEIILTNEEIQFIKEKSWYKKNKNINDCIIDVNEVIDHCNQIINLSKQLIEIFTTENDKTGIKKYTKEIETQENEIKLRKKIINYLKQHNNTNIQTLIPQ